MPPLEVVERETMAERLYAQLREAIMTGHFAPGQLLSLRSVAEAVGSSTMPVRAALTRLQAEGALIDGPGRALMVPPMTLELLEELRDVRIALEGCVAERAARRIADEDIGPVERICDEMDAHAQAGRSSDYLQSNFEFHISIYSHGASALTLGTIQNLWMRIGPFLNLVTPDVGHMQRSMVAHRIIVDALRRHDGAQARAGIEQDIREAADDLAERLDQLREKRA